MAMKPLSDKNLVLTPGTAQAPSTRKTSAPKRKAPTASPTVFEPANTEPAPAVTPVTPTPVAATHVAPTPAAPAPKAPAPQTRASQEAIAALAYSYWIERGCQGGSPEADWARAEHELRGAVATA